VSSASKFADKFVVADCRIDVIIVMDSSDSMNRVRRFNRLKSFVSDFVAEMDVNSGDTRVGILSHSADGQESINLNQYDGNLSGLQGAIDALTFQRGETNTGDALEYVRTSMLTAAAGDRADVPNVVLVLTAGESNNPTKTSVGATFPMQMHDG